VVPVTVPAPGRHEQAVRAGQQGPQPLRDLGTGLADRSVGDAPLHQLDVGTQQVDRDPRLLGPRRDEVLGARARTGVRGGAVRDDDDRDRDAAGGRVGDQPAGAEGLVVGVGGQHDQA
jgi:hypothetical protein